MFSTTGRAIAFLCFSAALAVFGNTFFAGTASAQGFMDVATSTGTRGQLSDGQMQAMLPDRGAFNFGSPYNTQGIRVTNASDCGGQDCVNYGYSYWPKINNSAGSNTMYVVVGLNAGKGGRGPSLFSINKSNNQVTPMGPLFDSGSVWSLNTAEYWYFSHSRPTTLYVNSPMTTTLQRFDIVSKQFSTVFDINTRQDLFGSNKYIWQYHTSADDRVHSFTIKDGSNYAELGCGVYREDTNQFSYYKTKGLYFDECQIDASGRYLIIKERVDPGTVEVDNRIIDVNNGTERLLTDHNGAGGHSDNGYGVMVAADNFNSAGAVRLWKLDMDMTGGEPVANVRGQGTLVYQTTDWMTDIEHLSFTNARNDVPIEQQYACGGGANRTNYPRANEILCFKLDGSLNTLIVAPNLVNLNASGGGDDYNKYPKGNLDPTGEYFLWTANHGTNRLDAFIVKIPVSQMGATPSSPSSSDSSSNSTPAPSSSSASNTPAPAPSTGDCATLVIKPRSMSGKNVIPLSGVKTATCSGSPSSSSSPASTPAPAPAPAPSSSTAGAAGVSWTSVVNANASGNNLMKSGGCDGCADAGAVSAQQISSGDGYVEFTTTESGTLRFIGLSSGNSGTSGEEIKFALRLQGGTAEVRESGTYKSETSFSAGDTLRIAIAGGKVQYSKNGSVFYTSAAAPSYPALVDTSLFNANAELWNVMIAGAR